MNKNQILLAGLATALFATAATADVTIYIGGSTAFRKAVYTAASAALTTPTINGAVGDNSWTMRGTAAGISGNTTIKASFAGSVGGVDNVANSHAVTFLLNPTPGDTNTESHVPDFAMSDSQQKSTPFTSPILVDTKVGVLPFAWVKGVESPADLVNITAGQAANLLTYPIPLSLITGNVLETNNVFAIGRDDDSGTRVIAFAESGFGITAAPNQFQLTGTAIDLWPAVGAFPAGFQGYPSGSTLVAALKTVGTTTALDPLTGLSNGYVLIGYAGRGDANSVFVAPQLSGSNKLTYNGVAESDQNIIEGSYSFWSYEHLLHKSGLGADYITFRNALVSKFNSPTSAASQSGLRLDQMHVSRQNDASPISHN